jgi:hypothetical protein
MYPIPEYRPSTPQSAAQPEMVDTVKTYKSAQRWPRPTVFVSHGSKTEQNIWFPVPRCKGEEESGVAERNKK